MALAITAETGRSPLDVLDDFSSFYFETLLSASPAALPSLLAFAKPGHILFGSDWPFAPAEAGQYFAAHLDTFSATTPAQRDEINRESAFRLFSRFGTAKPLPRTPMPARIGSRMKRAAVRTVVKAMQVK